jgi:hypothetical protein
MSSFTDPGYLPRSSPHEAIDTEKQNNLTVDSSGKYYPMPKSKTIKINDCEYEIKYCVSNNLINTIKSCFQKILKI